MIAAPAHQAVRFREYQRGADNLCAAFVARMSLLAAAALLSCLPSQMLPAQGVPWRCPAPFSPQSRAQMAAPSFGGGPGLFEVPSATSFVEGDIAGSYHQARLIDAQRPLRSQHNGFFTVAFLPRLSLSARGAVFHVQDGWDENNRDASANAHLQLLDERSWRPALAIGMHDVSGANAMFTAAYATLTKSVGGRVRLTAGYGEGQRLLHGPFGGIEVAPCPWVSVIAEHDGRQRSAGLRLFPFPSLADRFGLRPTLDAAWLGKQGLVAGAGLRFAAGPARQHRPLAVPRTDGVSRRQFGPAEIAVDRAAASVRDALAAAGLENVRILPIAHGMLDVRLENRRWVLDDMDGIGVALAVIATHAAAGVTHVRLTVRKADVAVLTLTTGLAPWRAYLDDPRQERAFVDQLIVGAPAAEPPAMEGSPINRSAFRLDITARPRAETFLLSEVGTFPTRLSLLPEFVAYLAPGVMVSGRRAFLMRESEPFPDGYYERGGDRLLLHAAARLPASLLPHGAMGIGQVSIGRLGQRQVGVHWDHEVMFRGGRWSTGVTAAVFGEAASRIEKGYGFATVRWRRPEQEITTSLSVGRYRYGDVGAVAEVGRRFGLTDITLILKATDLPKQAGIRVTVPLSPRRQMRPAAVRVVLPDYFAHMEDVTILEPFPEVRTDVAESLDIGHDVARTYFGQNRLNAGNLRARVWAMRNAALRGGW